MKAFKIIPVLVITLLLAACGETSTSTSGLPTPDAPSNTGGTLPSTPSTDPAIPNLTGAAPINLIDKTSFTALNDLLSPANQYVALPIVLEPLIKMTLTNDRSTYVKGKVLIAFEDRIGFWGAELNTVEGASVRNSTNVDSIHADNEFTLRILSAISGNDIYGVIYYRIRKSYPIAETQCLPQTTTCVDAWGRPLPDSYCNFTGNNRVETCRNYMNPSDSNVKLMGSFQAKVNEWFTN